MTTTMTIAQAEKVWRKAFDENERVSSVRTYNAEQAAWDAYVDLCDEIDQCQQPGCRATVPEYAYCSRHRPA